jgi:aspartate aminotransferase
MLSNKIELLNTSLTLAIAQKTASLITKGHDVISLAVGESHFTTPLCIKEAAHLAIEKNISYYTPVDGLPTLKEAICTKLLRDNKLTYTPQEVIATNGCKQALFNAFYSLLNPGDEVIIGSPYWPSYPEMVTACDGIPIITPTTLSDRYLLTAATLREAITPKTKIVILNSPNNPTGQLYTRQELIDLADLLIHYPQIMICSDDIYEYTLWEGEFLNILNK